MCEILEPARQSLMSAVLQVDQLTGGYSRNKPVLHQVSFEVNPGEMVGMIGLNGAGKSTTMKHILGFMDPHEGQVRLRGKTVKESSEIYRSSLTYVPETPMLYEELTVKEHLELAAMAYGVDRTSYDERVETLLDLFQMRDKYESHSMHLSKGMRQKVMIMSAFIVRPPLYMIDEPFLGLDPLGIRSLLDCMVQMKNQGSSILLSSHILSTIENYCDRFIVLHRGSIIAQGTLDEVRAQAGQPDQPLEEVFYALVTRDG